MIRVGHEHVPAFFRCLSKKPSVLPASRASTALRSWSPTTRPPRMPNGSGRSPAATAFRSSPSTRPVLLATQLVWGTDPARKARQVGRAGAKRSARRRWSCIHPSAGRPRTRAGSRRSSANSRTSTASRSRWRTCSPGPSAARVVRAYSPSPYPTDLDVRSMTLDFSHAALGGRDGLEFALAMGERLRHIHLCDGLGGTIFDESPHPRPRLAAGRRGSRHAREHGLERLNRRRGAHPQGAHHRGTTRGGSAKRSPSRAPRSRTRRTP